MNELVPIPEPRGLPLLGNIAEISAKPIHDFMRLADTYGPIYRLRLGGKPLIIASSNALVNELCNEKRFRKSLKTSQSVIREGVHDGLFTAYEDEPNWGKAHRILTPAFGPLPIRAMFSDMHDIATQLCMKLARHGPHTPMHVADDFTRLALDTLALCAMDFRFNSFYREEMHPFVQAMGDFLTESGHRNRRPPLAPNFLYRAANEKFYSDIGILKDTANEVVEARKNNPSSKKDLLGAMLEGTDPQTGEKLSDENITNQLITFLIAGHETTSGLLSFAFYLLLKHPAEYQKVQEEVDRVLGRNPITVEHLGKLPYISAVLRETLRIHSSIGGIGVEPIEDTVLGGKYLIKEGDLVIALLEKAHIDPEVFGEDANEFRPERMTEENFARLNEQFPNCWKPFGNGKRACIGRPFAWQEAVIAVAMLFQNFNFTMYDPNYQLEIKETLTLKPDGFDMRASLRHGMTATELERRLAGDTNSLDDSSAKAKKQQSMPDSKASATGKPLSIYYGSNSGTCEAMAQRLAADAPSHGFRASTVAPLDEARQNLPQDHPVIIVTASYEGEPPSNAAHFVNWMQSLKGNEMEKVNYAVFGCGHHDWAQTFYRIPKLVDSTLESLGGTRLVPMGGADAARSDMFSDLDAWEDESLWPALKEKYGASDSGDTAGLQVGITVEVSNRRKATLRQDVEEALVVTTKTLTTSGSAKKHISIQLPTGMTYKAGDYLAVLPLNPTATVARVLRRFELAWDATFKIQADRPTSLPTGVPISARDILSAYVELSQPATKKNIMALAEATEDKPTIKELEKLAGDDYQEKVASKRVSVLDLLERFTSIALPIGAYLELLPPMRVRQYSISSSPLADPTMATLTFSVLDAPSLSGQGRYVGVASNFLGELSPGEKLHVAVRASAAPFHLPRDAENTPIICIAAGTGLSPFRGFVQERAAMLAAGRKLAPALLFYGCRDPEVDDLYNDEFAFWENLGAVQMRKAYSRATDKSEGCKYVQDRIYHNRADIVSLWPQGARVYICGSREVGKAVEETLIRIYQEWVLENMDKEISPEESREWFDNIKNERFATDVFD
ncbi:cytochrome P450 [Mariannaea sp. PMI_226]|nr:cytochrome P450 [Mariannaea sp. PMI_226]